MAASATGMAVCAAVFVASLLYQFGLLEGVACVATFVQLSLLSATVVDAMEDKQASSGMRSLAAILTAILVVVWFGVTYWKHSGAS
ncbi:MAG: hypothetical protein ABSA27_16235 [Terriglobales bacterium]|jgi:hypothetical protein